MERYNFNKMHKQAAGELLFIASNGAKFMAGLFVASLGLAGIGTGWATAAAAAPGKEDT